MRIAFDARGVQRWSDGLSTYVLQTLTHLLRVDRRNEYVILMGAGVRRQLEPLGLLGGSQVYPLITEVPFMGPAQHAAISWLVRRARADVYHYPHFDMPLLAHPRSIATVYDLNHIGFTGYFDSLRALKRGYSLATTTATLAAARHVITISNTTKSELLRRFPWLNPGKVSVIYIGLCDAFRADPTATQLEAFRKKFQLGGDRFILYVGTHRPHKNLDRLLAAYASLRQGGHVPHKLLLVGVTNEPGRLEQMIAAHGLAGQVTHLGYLSPEELPMAYRVSEVFSFCSLSEGFGIPLLEAMASRVPVVTSNIGAMAEVASDSAVLVDPFSTDAIAEGLRRVLTSEPLRRELIARGLKRVSEFAWDTAARKTLAIYAAAART